MSNVLIIDDNDGVREALQLLLELHELTAFCAASPREGLAILSRESINLVIQDMNFAEEKTSGAEGVALFGEIRNRWPDVPVVLLTAWTSLETAVDLVKAGAADYLGKPWDDNRLITTARNLLELQHTREQNRQMLAERNASRAALAEQYELCGTVYRSQAMHELIALACRVAPSDIAVMITGANGAGKEKLAEIVQANSLRRAQPFVRVNAGGLPGDLLEAELFGAEAGAYTGLTKTRIGRFEAADQGTLFLDEIGNLSAEGQNRLLRVLQSGEFERLGSSTTRKVDVRIISAPNADLRKAIAEGSFWEGLYYRLNVIALCVPSLRERPSDIAALAATFLGEERQLSDAAVRLLEQQSWPGNVRELQNLMSRVAVLADGNVIDADVLGLAPAERDHLLPEPTEDDIRRALMRNGDVVARAARELGMSRQALYRRMVKYGLHDKRSPNR